MKRAVSLIALVAVCVVMTGCGRIQAAFVPDPIVVTDEATTAVSPANLEGELGDGVPEGTPFWPGSRVEASDYTKGTATVTLVTGDPFDDVVAGIGVGYQRADWAVTTEDASTPDVKTALITASKANRQVLITVADAGDGAVTMEYLIQLEVE